MYGTVANSSNSAFPVVYGALIGNQVWSVFQSHSHILALQNIDLNRGFAYLRLHLIYWPQARILPDPHVNMPRGAIRRKSLL